MTDIFTVLKSDHDLHREMLDRIGKSSADGEDRQQLFEDFRVEVTAHAAAEEESLYAAMLADPDLREDGRHSVAEHKEIDDMLGELQEIEISSDDWMGKFKEMRHRYEHHIEEEEEDMFPAADAHFDDDKAQKLGAKYDRRKPEELELAEASDNGSDKE